jgi:hypothetical protein
MDTPRRDRRLVGGVALVLALLAVAGRLQSWGPAARGVGPSPPAAASAAPDSSSGLAVAGRVRLPGQPAAAAGWYRSALPWHLLLAAGSNGAWLVTGAAELIHVIPA